MRKFTRFISLSLKEKMLFAEAYMLLAFSKVAIILYPLKKIAPHLGELNGTLRTDVTSYEMAKAQDVRLYINMASGNAFWKSVCLDMAMAGMLMLKRRKVPCQLCLGVRKDKHQTALEAHAWIICGDDILIGGERSKTYIKVAGFTNSAVTAPAMGHQSNSLS